MADVNVPAGCLWGGPQTGSCWDVGACGCAVIPRPESSATRRRRALTDVELDVRECLASRRAAAREEA